MATLELPGGAAIEDPKPEDFKRALEQPRDDDWYLTLSRGEDDYIDATFDDGALSVGCEEGGIYRQAASQVDDAALEAMMTDFAAGGSAWRGMALWVEPPPKSAKAGKVPIPGIAAIAGGVFAVLFFGAMIFSDRRGNTLVPLLFALAFPGIIAVAAFVKMQDVKRAAKWTKGSARITRSELVTKTVNKQDVQVPHVEYEFTVGMDFNKVSGNRITLADIEGPHGAKETLARYRVGTSVPVYYDPANPRESVLDREPPPFFNAVWIFVAVLTAAILGGFYWFAWR